MSIDADALINGHLDGVLSREEQSTLEAWLKECPENTSRFVKAVMLHNRIRVHYMALKANLERVDSLRVPMTPSKLLPRRYIIAFSLGLTLFAGFLFLRNLTSSKPRDLAIAEYHQLVIQGRRAADRTYRITFVKDPADRPENPGKQKRSEEQALPGIEPMLYVRDGRQFVYSRRAVDGRKFFIGGNMKQTWAVRPGEPAEVGDLLHFTEGLPAGLYLAPVLSFFEGQERMLVNDYNLELRQPTKSSKLFVAVKKPDTKQGPRRIEISFSADQGKISEMRIWPETPDHRRTNHTLIQLISEERLADNWFNYEFHHPEHQKSAVSG